jgi:hypothetical protein
MFAENIKREGGWSLELINPENDCLGKNNWKGATSINGGTPGLENSVFDVNFFPMITSQIYQIVADDDVSEITVLIDGLIDETSILVDTDYSKNIVVESENKPDGTSQVVISLEEGLAKNINYFVIDNLLSCDGIKIFADTIWVSGFDVVEKGDLLVNEVMFNPKEGSSEFVEIFNNSEKYLSLRNVYLSNFTTEDGISKMDNEKRISDENVIFRPHSFVVITKDARKLVDVYKTASRSSFIEISSMPKLNNDEGNVAILNPALSFIDKMAYSSDMHVGLIPTSNQKGISLERIRVDNPSLDFNNWTSASQSSGGATPGLKNSVTPEKDIQTNMFEVSPEVFTPNNDGSFDVVELRYQTNKTGVVANVKIFNSNGVFVKEIENNFLMGASGSFIWNGMDKNNSLCEKGIYIFWVELFDEHGNVNAYKMICVLG